MLKSIGSSLFLFLILFSCIGEDVIDDYVDPDLRITNPIVNITVGRSYQFKPLFFDESGTKVTNPKLSWVIQPDDLGTIDEEGVLIALKPGAAVVIVSAQGLQNQTIKSETKFDILAPPQQETGPTEPQAGTDTETTDSDMTDTETTDTASDTTDSGTTGTESDTTDSTDSDTTSDTTDSNDDETDSGTTDTESDTTDSTDSDSTSDTTESDDETDSTNDGVTVAVTAYEGEIKSTSSYVLEGNFRYEHNGTQIVLSLDETYRASTALPGLYIYLSNNPNTVVGAFEIGAVTVFEGAHQYELPESMGIMDYKYILYWCKPFNVKVGEAQIF